VSDAQFRLTDGHIRAIEAQIQLILHDGGYGEVGLIIFKYRIARITTTTSDKVEDINGEWEQGESLRKPPMPKQGIDDSA
jgi:hypothetical protein